MDARARSRPGNRFDTVVGALRRGDVGTLAAKLARGTFPPALFRWNRIEVLALDGPPASRGSDGFTVRWARENEWSRLAAVKDRGEQFARFFASGAACALGEVHGEPACFAWISVAPSFTSRANGYAIRLRPGECWGFACEVASRWRGRGLYPALWSQAYALLAAQGYQRVLLAVHRDDVRSLRAHAKCGFRPVCSFGVLRALGLAVHWNSGRRGPGGPGGRRGRRAGFGPWVGPET